MCIKNVGFSFTAVVYPVLAIFISGYCLVLIKAKNNFMSASEKIIEFGRKSISKFRVILSDVIVAVKIK
jgi:hypothetical protein